jgi:hypothetical protein
VALPATDNFNRANAANLGANWTALNGNIGVDTNAAYANGAGLEIGVIWNADVFGNDQYSQATLTANGGAAAIGVLVRGTAGSGGTYYSYYIGGGGDGFLAHTIAGTWVQIGATDSGVWAVNDVLRLEAQGTTLRVYRNGSLFRTVTDTNIASGSAGLSGFDASTGTKVDTWEGGNIAAATPAIPRGVIIVGSQPLEYMEV